MTIIANEHTPAQDPRRNRALPGTVRVGVVGTGQIGTAHAVSLAREISGATVSVVYDADASRAVAVGQRLGARSVNLPEELFAAPDVDAVLIASPEASHAEQLLAALQQDKPILCEKPLATTQAEAKEVVDAEVAHGRRLIQVGFMRRFDSGYNQLKNELTADGIGAPLVVHHVHRNTRASSELVTEQTLTNMLVHEFDITRWLIGEEITSVLTLAGKPGPLTPQGERDPLLVVLRTDSGVLVEIEGFVNAQYGYEVTCRVTGEQGQAELGHGSYITRSRDLHRGVELPEHWLGRFADSYRSQLQGWVDAILADRNLPGATAWDGYVGTVISHCAIESYRSQREAPTDVAVAPELYQSDEQLAGVSPIPIT